MLNRHHSPAGNHPPTPSFPAGEALQHASVARRQDKEIVLAAVQRWGRALQVAAAHLRDDKAGAMGSHG